MRLWMAAILVAGTALPLAACNRDEIPKEDQAATAAPRKIYETPTRKPGLWKQVMSIQGTPISQTAELCLDPDSDKKLAWWAQQGVRSGCAKNEVTRRPDGSWGFSYACDMAGGIHTNTSGKATGDFQSAYTVTAESTTTGAAIPQMNATRTVVIDATWTGECPAGMAPGDMRLPDGRKMNVLAASNDDDAAARARAAVAADTAAADASAGIR